MNQLSQKYSYTYFTLTCYIDSANTSTYVCPEVFILFSIASACLFASMKFVSDFKFPKLSWITVYITRDLNAI